MTGVSRTLPDGTRLVLPDYGGGCIADLVPAVLGFADCGRDTLLPPANPLLDESVLKARAVVLVLIDGLGAQQLAATLRCCPTLAEMSAKTITTVAPSTTASALTSVSTGVPPGEHGIVGYRIATQFGNLNVLSWETPTGKAHKRIRPEEFQPFEAFGGQRPPVVSFKKYEGSGFTRAHLRGVRHIGIRKLSSLVVETRRLLVSGEPFVYAYYDGPDVVAHEHGFGEHYESELRYCDRLVADLLMASPRGTAVVVTSDHGLVDCTDSVTVVDRSVVKHAAGESGEHRFRWLHAKPGRARSLYESAEAAHGDCAWVITAEELIDTGLLGPVVTDAARRRLGDVALVATGHHAFAFAETGSGRPKPSSLKGRHGSLTPAEMLVPLLTFTT